MLCVGMAALPSSLTPHNYEISRIIVSVQIIPTVKVLLKKALLAHFAHEYLYYIFSAWLP